MKNFILSCLALVGILSFAGCSSDSDKSSTTTSSQSATMQTDSKDMHSTH